MISQQKPYKQIIEKNLRLLDKMKQLERNQKNKDLLNQIKPYLPPNLQKAVLEHFQ
jgi:hypothetical protein